MSEWESYLLHDYRITFDPDTLVLDIGCGRGSQMEELRLHGVNVIGLDLEHSVLLKCRSKGLDVLRGRAEQLPIKEDSVDGILCKVVLPYTREDQAIKEFNRVLKSGGICYLNGHGAGYYLKYLLLSPSFKQRFYGLRSLVNTWLWVLAGSRLPGFMGDTTYQSRRRLNRYFSENRFNLSKDTPSKRFLGFPVFTYQIIQKLPE